MTTGRAKGIRAGRAFVEVGGDDTQLARVLRRASARLKAFGAGVAKIGAGFAAVGAAISAPLAAATGIFAKFGDQLDKTAARTGLSVEALSELGFAAERSGASLDNVEKAVRKLAVVTRGAQLGQKEFADAFAELGINVVEFAKLNPEQQFSRIAEALSRVEAPGRRAALAIKLLEESGAQLLPLLSLGANGIEALREEARRLGITIDTETATAAAQLTDALGDVKSQVRAVAVSIGAALGPALTDIIRLLNPIVADVIAFVKANKGLVAGVAIGAAALIALGTALIGVGAVITLIGVGLGGLATVIGAVLTPVGLAIAGAVAVAAAVAAAGVAILRYTSVGKAAVQAFAQVWRRLLPRVIDVISAIGRALRAGDLSVAVEVLTASVLLSWEKGQAAILDSTINFGISLIRIFNSIMGSVLKTVFTGIDILIQSVLASADAIAKTNFAATLGLAVTSGNDRITQDLQDGINSRDAQLDELKKALDDGTGATIDAARDRLYQAIEDSIRLSEEANSRRSQFFGDLGEDLQRRIDAFGSFGGGRLDQQFGASSVGNRQLEEQKKTAKNTAKLVQAVDTLTTRLAFG